MDRHAVKAVWNRVNLATPLGLLVARAGRAEVRRGPRGLFLAGGYSLPLPRNPAFTVGNVVLTRQGSDWLLDRPSLLAHEERHTWQYAACLGLPLLPLYALGALWSWAVGGDPGVRNPFERHAGLADGGYPDTVSRRRRRTGRRGTA